MQRSAFLRGRVRNKKQNKNSGSCDSLLGESVFPHFEDQHNMVSKSPDSGDQVSGFRSSSKAV